MIMKTNKIILSMMAASLVLLTTSCENGDKEFDDYDYQTVYFARQTPVRTIVLGDDVYDTTLDNLHQCKIMVTLGGVWSNKKDRTVKIEVDESLCDNLYFEDGTAVTPMPSDYYELETTTVTIPEGEIYGGTIVQLSDAFFDDPLSLDVHYVIPVRIIEAQDSILSGEAKDGVDDPVVTNPDDWDTEPMNYQLYAVKYINKYDGAWISHGTDYFDINGEESTVEREEEYLEYNEIRYLETLSLQSCSYEVETTVSKLDDAGSETTEILTCDLILNFDDDDNCEITTETEDCEAYGDGIWEYQAALQAWGDADRDQITMNYTITYYYTEQGAQRYVKLTSDDILVMRDRQSKLEDFDYTYED